MLDYTPEFLAGPILADRKRDMQAIARASAVRRASGRRPRGFRAAFAVHLVRLAIALHHEAADLADLQPETESPR
jgi:hypothetical protein